MAVTKSNEDDTKLTVSRDELRALIQQEAETLAHTIAEEKLSRIGQPAVSTDTAMAIGEAIAINTAEIANQGTGKRAPLDPKVVKQRRLAKEEMLAALKEYADAGDTPEYQIMQVCFLYGTQVYPQSNNPYGPPVDTVIGWPHIPNLAMRSVNESAKQVFALFMKSIGNEGAEGLAMSHGYDKAPSRTGKNLLFKQGGFGATNVSDAGKEHAQGKSLSFVQGAPTDQKFVAKIGRQ